MLNFGNIILKFTHFFLFEWSVLKQTEMKSECNKKQQI